MEPAFACTSAVPHSASSVAGATAALQNSRVSNEVTVGRQSKRLPGYSSRFARSGSTAFGGCTRVGDGIQSLR